MPRTRSFAKSRSSVRPLTPVSEVESDTTETTNSTTNNHDATSSATSSATNSTNEPPPAHRRPHFSGLRALVIPSTYRNHDDPAQQQSKPLSTRENPPVYCPSTGQDRCEQYPHVQEPLFELDGNSIADDKRWMDEGIDKDFGATSPTFEWETHLRDILPMQKQLGEDNTQGSEISLDYATSQPVTIIGTPSAIQLQSQPSTSFECVEELNDNEADWDGEDVKSHHTVSEADDDDFEDYVADYTTFRQGSIYDSSNTKEKQLKKLKKKATPPAPYHETKVAKDGKTMWTMPLYGNAYRP